MNHIPLYKLHRGSPESDRFKLNADGSDPNCTPICCFFPFMPINFNFAH